MSARRAWKFAAIITISLLMGAATTIAIAWHYARWPTSPIAMHPTSWSHEGSAWLYQRHDFTAATQVEGVPATAWAASNSVIPVIRPPAWSRMLQPPEAGDPTTRIMEQAFGWPYRSLCCSYALNPNMGPRGWYTARSAIELSVQHPTDRNRFLALPLKPYWSGFLANTFMFALAAFPLILSVMVVLRWSYSVRSRWRRHRGRCPSCGYQLQTKVEIGCPECGWNRQP